MERPNGPQLQSRLEAWDAGEAPAGNDAGGSLDRVSMCEYQLRMALEFVKMADQKARFLMRLSLGLFAATFVGLPPSVAVLKQSLAEGGRSAAGLGVFAVVMGLYLVCAVCLVVALMKIVAVVRPRLIKGQDETDRPSSLFFQSVARSSPDGVRQMLERMDEQQLVTELSTQIYHNAVVAERKYKKLDAAISWMLGGGLFGVVFALLVIVSAKLL